MLTEREREYSARYFSKHRDRKLASQRAYYGRVKNNPEFKARRRAAVVKCGRASKAKQRIIEYFSLHPCVDCGMADYRCLEFDHVRGVKEFEISRVAYSWDRVLREIEKCDVRCANCHRIRHADTRKPTD